MKQVVELPRSTRPCPGSPDGPPRLRVVVADDTADVRALLCYTLDLDGRFDVVGEAGDGVEAVRSVEAERPDAVVLDLAMPVMDGLRAIPLILERSPRTRIVVLSGFNSSELAHDAMSRGAHAYVEKGATFNKLTGVLADVCAAGRRPPSAPPPATSAPATSAPRGPGALGAVPARRVRTDRPDDRRWTAAPAGWARTAETMLR